MRASFITALLVLLWNSPEVLGQQFENYAQSVNGESFSIEMIAVPGGTFFMGAADDDKTRKADEKPMHEVFVDSLWMGKYEISWEQYDAFVFGDFGEEQFLDTEALSLLGIDGVSGATAPYEDMSNDMGKDNAPAVNMTQYAALMFCKWLTAKTGVFYRLPTEAEWEFVCKTGNTDPIESLDSIAVYKLNSNGKYAERGSLDANELGIHDLLGNVSEWVLDAYESKYYKRSPKNNPWNVPVELYPRVVRGGSWKDTATKTCCTSRLKSEVKWKRRDPQIPKSNWWHTNADFIGFRVVRPLNQPSKEAIASYWLEAVEDY